MKYQELFERFKDESGKYDPDGRDIEDIFDWAVDAGRESGPRLIQFIDNDYYSRANFIFEVPRGLDLKGTREEYRRWMKSGVGVDLGVPLSRWLEKYGCREAGSVENFYEDETD